MGHSTLKTLFFIVLAVWLPTLVELSIFEQLQKNKQCNASNFGGIYFFEQYRCCKEKGLIFEDPELISNECNLQIGKDKPNDDMATYMWKVEACKYKNAMDLQEDKLDFKTFVEFMTTNYTSSNNIQGLIRDKITKCPDGDNETEFHKKFQAYYLCFFKNEQEICEDPSAKGIAYKTKHISDLERITANDTETCSPFPGAWNQPGFCCKGKTTPQKWQHQPLYGYSHWDEVESNKVTMDCINKIGNLYPAVLIFKESLTPWEEYESSQLTCYDSCLRNPVMFQNGSTPQVIFDFNKTLEIYAGNSSLPSGVVNHLKEIASRHKGTFKMAFTDEDYEKETGITFDEIETQFSTLSDQQMQIKYYCTYYQNIRVLFETAIAEHCGSEEAFKKYFKHKTRMPFALEL